MKFKYTMAITGFSCWSGLGFYRGINHYKYKHDNDKYKISKNYLYSDSIIYGFYGLIMYINPPLLPFAIYKELYRFEVNMRNLEDEKKTEYFNTVL